MQHTQSQRIGLLLLLLVLPAGRYLGLHIDPESQTLLPTIPAMHVSLDLLASLAPYSAPAPSLNDTDVPAGCAAVHPGFAQGRCVIAIGGAAQFKAAAVAAAGSRIAGLVDTYPLPGSAVVYNRQSGEMEGCRVDTCPYADDDEPLSGSLAPVNRAPYLMSGSALLLSVARHTPDPAAAFSALQWALYQGSSQASWERVLHPTSPAAPARSEQLGGEGQEAQARVVARWEAAGEPLQAVCICLCSR
jgi:hypothetical protein